MEKEITEPEMLLRVLTTLIILLALSMLSFAQETQVETEWVRVWPCEADGAKTVCDAGGNPFPSTGENACIWFKWGGAGSWKRFRVKKNRPVMIKAQGDSGPGACLGRLDFKVSEIDANGKLTEKWEFDGPTWNGVAPQGEPKYRLIYWTPETEKFEILCTGGFYVYVYQECDKATKSKLSDDEKSKVNELIKKLGCDNWREREESQKKLMKMDERILPLLKKHTDSKEIEVRIRVRKIIEALTPLTGEAVSVEAMKREAEELIEKLAKYVEANKLKWDSEPASGMGTMGPYATPALEKFLDSEYVEFRKRAVYLLASSKIEGTEKKLIPILTCDKAEQVRFITAFALRNFNTPEVREALKKASENDKSEKVCAAAAEALKYLMSNKPSDE